MAFYRYHAFGFTLLLLLAPLPSAKTPSASNEGLVDGELHHIEGIEKKYPNLLRVPVVINRSDTVTMARDPCIRIKGWESLRPYRIGFVRGTVIMETGTRGMNVTRITELDDLFPTLQAGHVDLVLTARLEAMARMTQPLPTACTSWSHRFTSPHSITT